MADEKKEKEIKAVKYPTVPEYITQINLQYISDHADADPAVLDWFIKYHEEHPDEKFVTVRSAYVEAFHKGAFKKKPVKPLGAMEKLYQRLKEKQ